MSDSAPAAGNGRRLAAAYLRQAADLSQRSVLIGVLGKAGFDGARLLEHAGSTELVGKLANNTAAAAERGVFGSPTMFVNGEMFFGNDRLDFVAAGLRRMDQ